MLSIALSSALKNSLVHAYDRRELLNENNNDVLLDITADSKSGTYYDYDDNSYESKPRNTFEEGNANPTRPPSKRYNPRQQTFSTLGGLLKNPRQLGATLLGLGFLLTFMGMMLFFEGTLLRLGNVRHEMF